MVDVSLNKLYMNAEVEQGKAKGEGEQHGFVWQGHVWQAPFRSS